MNKTFNRILAGCVLAGVFFVGYLARDISGLWPNAQAQSGNANNSQRCSLRTLNGAYGVKFEGEKIGLGPLVSVSRFTFDGNGTFTTQEKARLNGVLIERTF